VRANGASGSDETRARSPGWPSDRLASSPCHGLSTARRLLTWRLPIRISAAVFLILTFTLTLAFTLTGGRYDPERDDQALEQLLRNVFLEYKPDHFLGRVRINIRIATPGFPTPGLTTPRFTAVRRFAAPGFPAPRFTAVRRFAAPGFSAPRFTARRLARRFSRRFSRRLARRFSRRLAWRLARGLARRLAGRLARGLARRLAGRIARRLTAFLFATAWLVAGPSATGTAATT
jgi:hypothetical protein